MIPPYNAIPVQFKIFKLFCLWNLNLGQFSVYFTSSIVYNTAWKQRHKVSQSGLPAMHFDEAAKKKKEENYVIS